MILSTTSDQNVHFSSSYPKPKAEIQKASIEHIGDQVKIHFGNGEESLLNPIPTTIATLQEWKLQGLLSDGEVSDLESQLGIE